jgi:hypothetical protein
MKLAIGLFMSFGGLFWILVTYFHFDHEAVKWTLAGAITFEIGFNRYLLPSISKKQEPDDRDRVSN